MREIEWYYLYKIILRNGGDAAERVECLESRWEDDSAEKTLCPYSLGLLYVKPK